jgi:hypothetical protein
MARFVLPQAEGKAAAMWNRRPFGSMTRMSSMCSASQPSSRAITDAMRSAKHFFARIALPPYPEPYDQTSRVSGKCTMYFSSLQGQTASDCPGSSGAPTECTVFTHGFPAAISCSTGVPTRVMIPMDATAYALSVSCTPMCDSGPPTVPSENGTTYRVRPRMEPANRPCRVGRISAGATQLFVGPASDSRVDAMNVRASVRATSSGCERARYEPGRHCGLSLISLPSSTMPRSSASFSAREPSTQWTRSGRVSAATSSTHAYSCSIAVPCMSGRSPKAADAGTAAPAGPFRRCGAEA